MKPRPNAPCPCGSGRKFKKCHGAAGAAPTLARATSAGVAEWMQRGAQMEAASQLQDAEQCYQRVLQLDPSFADAWFAMGGLAERAGDPEAARECYSRLAALHPGHARGHFALGNIHAALFAFDLAKREYRRALELEPNLAGVWGNLGNIEKYLGRIPEALDCYHHAIDAETDPTQQARRHSNLLLALHYDEALSHDALFRAHVEWADRHARRLYRAPGPWPQVADAARRLRIAYVSGSFADGEIMEHFLAGVLAHHDPSQFEIFMYSTSGAGKPPSPRIQQLADTWIDLGRMDDAAAAERIRADAIDIAVDLDGHNPSGRLLIFAARPAPIQVEWLDWFNTSGMETIDFILTDPYTTPATSPQRFSEMPIRLPHSRFCYSPVAYSPPVAPMPHLSGAPFTFGSFNRQDKLHPPLYRIWAEILEAVPDARLLLKNRALRAASVRDGVMEHFARLGIARDRLLLRGPTDHATMLGEYGDVDIALDTFPYNGGLTTCECLWMGVPMVALEAERMIGRQTSAMLRLLGMDDWVATSTADYVRLAIAKRAQVDAAARLRTTLRQRFAESPVCDAARFARDLETAFRSMWQRHCSGTGPRQA